MSEKRDDINLVSTLLATPLFEDLEVTQMARLLNVCQRREVQPGDILCEPRTIDRRLLILLAGKLRLESAEGVPLAELTPIRFIGEMGVLTGQIRGSRVVVEEASTLLELEAADLESLAEEDPELEHHLFVNLIKLLYDRMHEMNEEIAALRRWGDLLGKRLEELVPNDPLLADLSVR